MFPSRRLERIGRSVGRGHGWILAAIVGLAAAVRWSFLQQMDVPFFDPWRHLQLIENLRAGLGFTLFDGQPYLWYSPVWYALCAALPSGLGAQWPAAVLSVLSVALLYAFLHMTATEHKTRVAAAGALLMAAFGPVIAFTCHYGSESFALFLMLAALVVCARSAGALSAVIGGVLLGTALVSRMNFAFNLLLFLPLLRTFRRGLAFAAGLAAPMALTFWRNARTIHDYPYIFSWDGLATRSEDYSLLSTLVVQMQDSAQEAIRRFCERLLPGPEWLAHWELVLFVVCAGMFLVLSRRLSLILTGSLTVVYFLSMDRSLISNFFRINLALFPVLFMGIAVVVGSLHRRGWKPALAGWGMVALALFAGAGHLTPKLMYPLEDVTPPPELLSEKAYMVTSGFYQPESLIYRFPDKRFVGMPLDPEDFEDFRSHYSDYEYILWHGFGVQDELGRYLVESGKYEIVRAAENMYGRTYVVFRERSVDAEPRIGWDDIRPAGYTP